MKYTLLVLIFLLFSGNAQAVCSGGFNGENSVFQGCSELGALGDLIYKRDENGKVLGKRDEAEIKAYLVSVVEGRLRTRGVTMKDKDGQTSIVVNEENVVFDLFNQNGDLVYTYTVDLEKGIPENEKELMASREQLDAQRSEHKEARKKRLAEIQALGDKIKAEDIDSKAAAK